MVSKCLCYLHVYNRPDRQGRYLVFEIMFKLLVVISCASLAAALPGKIIGGQKADDGQFPALVSLQSALGHSHFCGGGLISDRLILTAGHCFVDNKNPANSVAYVGSIDKTQGGTYYKLSRVVVHEDFNMDELFNDVTLLQTAEPVKLSNLVQPIALPKAGQAIADDTPVVAVGWGTINYPITINPKVLHYVNLGVVGNDECARRLDAEIADGQICVGGVDGKGLCYGDSGSPLIMGNTTVGIVSWGQPCGVGYPDVFTRVSSYIDWIERNAALLSAEQ